MALLLRKRKEDYPQLRLRPAPSIQPVINRGGQIYAGGKATHLPSKEAFYTFIKENPNISTQELSNNPFGVSFQEIQSGRRNQFAKNYQGLTPQAQQSIIKSFQPGGARAALPDASERLSFAREMYGQARPVTPYERSGALKAISWLSPNLANTLENVFSGVVNPRLIDRMESQGKITPETAGNLRRQELAQMGLTPTSPTSEVVRRGALPPVGAGLEYLTLRTAPTVFGKVTYPRAALRGAGEVGAILGIQEASQPQATPGSVALQTGVGVATGGLLAPLGVAAGRGISRVLANRAERSALRGAAREAQITPETVRTLESPDVRPPELRTTADAVAERIAPRPTTNLLDNLTQALGRVPRTADDIMQLARTVDDPEQIKAILEPTLRQNPELAAQLELDLNAKGFRNVQEAWDAAQSEQPLTAPAREAGVTEPLEETALQAREEGPVAAVAGEELTGPLSPVEEALAPEQAVANAAQSQIPETARVSQQIDAVPLTQREIEQGRALGMSERQLREAKRPDLVQEIQNLEQAAAQGRSVEATAQLNQGAPRTEMPIAEAPPPPTKLESLTDKPTAKAFDNTTGSWLGQRRASAIQNTALVRGLPQLSDADSLRLITAVEEGLQSGRFGDAPDQVRALLDAKYAELVNAGVDVGYLENYFPHYGIWENPERVAEMYRIMKIRSGFQNTRIYPTVQEGLQMGAKLRVRDYRVVLQNYLDVADALLADRRYFNQLRSQGLIFEGGDRPPGAVMIEAPGLTQPKFLDSDSGQTIIGAYYAHPTIAAKVNRLFSPDIRTTVPGKVIRVTAKASSGVQGVRLSAGVPFTWLNSFGIMQGVRNVLGGNIRGPIKGGLLSLSKKLTYRYFDKNADDFAEVLSQNIDLRTVYTKKSIQGFVARVKQSANEVAEAAGKDVSTTNIVARSLGEAWDMAFNDPTFGRYLPIMQLENYKAIRNMLVHLGVPYDQAVARAATRLREFNGMLTLSKSALQSPIVKDVFTTAFMAPRYRGAMIRFWANNVKALAPQNIVKALNPRNGEYRANLLFMMSSFAMLWKMNELNKEFNEGRSMWENPPGKQDKLLIPIGNGRTIGVPFLSSIATIPRNVLLGGINVVRGEGREAYQNAASLMSVGARPLVDVAANEDYFGNQIRDPNAPPSEQFADIGTYLFSQTQHPYVTAAINKGEKPDIQIASEALELPFRFYKDTAISRALVEDEFKQTWGKASHGDRQAFERFHPGANEFGDFEDQPDNPAFFRERAVAYQNNGLFELEKKYAELQNKYQGKPIDPIFNLSEAQRRKALWKDTLVPGAKDPELSNLYKQEWYHDFQNARGRYYDQKKDYNLSQADKYEKRGGPEGIKIAQKIRNSVNSVDNPYPETPEWLQEVMDRYSALPKGTGDRSAWIRANPDAWAAMTGQWAAIDNWQNRAREKLGLAATEGAEGIAGGFQEPFTPFTSSGGGGRRGRRISVKESSPVPDTIPGGEVKVKAPPKTKIALKKSKKQPKVAAVKVKKGRRNRPSGRV